MYFLLFEETSEHRRSVVCTSAAKCAWKPFSDRPNVLRYPRSLGTWSDDRLVNISLGDSALPKKFTGSPIAACVGPGVAGRKRFGAAL
jgi:hypothetical protein